MAPKKQVRRRLLADPKVQVPLVARIVLYWLMCLSIITVMIQCRQTAAGSAQTADNMLFFYRVAFLGALAFLPLALVDLVQVSNRFAIPMVRLRRAMQDLSRGEHVEPVRFRDGDFWQDLAADFNAVVNRVQGQDNGRQPEVRRASTPGETMQLAGTVREVSEDWRHHPGAEKVAQTIKTLGGFQRMTEVLEVIKEAGGVKKFKDLAEAMACPEADVVSF